MALDNVSLHWAIDFVHGHSDGDLFPKILEVEALASERTDFISQVIGRSLGDLQPGACRRFLVPKDEYSYRQATQLDPQDSIILSAIVYRYGGGIEARRLPADKVFSYRFLPTAQDGLYSNRTAWNDFWRVAASKARTASHVLYCDIAGFYNQIYHHVVENQLAQSSVPDPEIRWLMNLLRSTTAFVSRGVPVGPHGIHLIAEATMIPIDNSLAIAGLDFVRYADDIIVFCKSEREAKSTLFQIASVLDRQQRLTLQRHKTKVHTSEAFQKLCVKMIEDRPISPDEDALLKLISKYSGGNPYKMISYDQISPSDWKSISPEVIRKIVESYVSSPFVDYIRLRWFYRRLSQVGHPGAIEVSLERIGTLGPCLANICSYFSSVKSIPQVAWERIGAQLLDLLQSPEIQSNEYFRLSILSLFSRNAEIDHTSKLLGLYQSADPFVRREIVLAAWVNGAHDWLRELKESLPAMDPWQQHAYVYAVSGLPKDEKTFLLRHWGGNRPFHKSLAKWSMAS